MPRCPRDTKLNYKMSFCKEMVKSGIRVWCKNCKMVKQPKKKGKKNVAN